MKRCYFISHCLNFSFLLQLLSNVVLGALTVQTAKSVTAVLSLAAADVSTRRGVKNQSQRYASKIHTLNFSHLFDASY